MKDEVMLFVSKCHFWSSCLNFISSVVKVNPVSSLTDRYNQFTERKSLLLHSSSLWILLDIINLEKHFYSLNIDF